MQWLFQRGSLATGAYALASPDRMFLAFQHTLYVLMEPFAFLKHDAEEPLALVIRQVRIVSKNFREAPDRCQRRLQLGDSRQHVVVRCQ